MEVIGYIQWFLGFFDKGFQDFIYGQIKKSEREDIYSLEELAQRYPQIKEHAIRSARSKIKLQTHGLDIFKQNTSRMQFTRYKTGVELVKPLIEAIAIAVFSPDPLVTAVLKTFESAVSSGGLITYNFHDGEDTLEEYEVKDETKRGGQGIEIAYIYINIKSKKISGWFYDDSDTTVTYTFKVAKFVNLDSLVRWLLE